ncbi:MAG: hypothetical protein BRD28_05850 [Bacteroidetes bacterium QH_10_64_37]|nr:MAG: hypothetical protein BRD28_05850 [Bacteroidetes bacterium QH_10_64_37]
MISRKAGEEKHFYPKKCFSRNHQSPLKTDPPAQSFILALDSQSGSDHPAYFLFRRPVNSFHETRQSVMTSLPTDDKSPHSPSELQSLSRTQPAQNMQIQRLEELAGASRNGHQSMTNSVLPEVSHELKTRLAGIGMLADTLSGSAGDRGEELAMLIEKSTTQLQDTLDAVLTLAELEANQSSLEMSPLSVPDEVESVFRTFEPQAESKGLDYTFTVEDADDYLHASLNSGALSSIVQNLIANAIEYTETGSVHVSVRSVSPWGSPMVEIEVADTGVGISDSFAPKLFDRFEQESTESHGFTKGVGLGLTLVKRFTARMGGTIDVESEKGQGSQFRIRLPRFPEQNPARPSASSNGSAGCEKEILFIEGDPNTRRAICGLIEDRWGITPVCSSEDGLEAVSKRRAVSNKASPGGPPFDLVLLGVDRDDRSSDETFLRELEDRTNGHEIPVVALALGNQRDSAELEIDGLISEPFTSSKLVFEIARYLGK